MADKKITQLTSLVQADIVPGTDVLPIVDVSASLTCKSTPNAIVNNVLTNATALGVGVSPSSISASYKSIELGAVGNEWSSASLVNNFSANAIRGSSWQYGASNKALLYQQDVAAGEHAWYTAASGTAGNSIPFTQTLLLTSGGDFSVKTGNFVLGTAAKGVNFTANTPAAGMTSQLLNWYEEGTWVPNQGAGLTLVGAFSSAGTYTRIGRQVFIRGSVSGATSVAVASAGAITTNLPYSAAADATGTAINAANNASSILRVSSATLTAATAIAATTTITFSAVYSV